MAENKTTNLNDVSDDDRTVKLEVTEKLSEKECERTIRITPAMTGAINKDDPEREAILRRSRENAMGKVEAAGRGASMTSTRLLNYLLGKKLRNVDAEIEKNIQIAVGSGVAWDTESNHLGDVKESFEITSLLGEGGQGIVNRASDLSLKREVAVKSLRKELLADQESRNSFLTEARVTASLEHPAVIPVYALKTDAGGGLHLAMKLLRGESLRERLRGICASYRREGIAGFDENASLHNRLEIFLRVCDAMEYVHKKGVIHCDLKPENIMIGEYHETYVLDWGIARRIGEVLPPGHKIMGTPRYTSPENLEDSVCDARSDIYTLGVILFEVVTLHAAFSGSSTTEVVTKVRRGQFNLLRHQFGMRIPRDLAAIVRKATALKPEARYQSVAELSADLRSFMLGNEVKAKPDGFFGRIWRWMLHHIRGVLTTAIILGIGVIAISTVSVIARNAAMTMKERQRGMAMAFSYSRLRNVAEEIQMQFSHISGGLRLLEKSVALLLDLKNSPSVPVPNADIRWSDPEHPSKKGFLPAPGSGFPFSISKPIDLEKATALRLPGADRALVESECARLFPVVRQMKRSVFVSSGAGEENGVASYMHGDLSVAFVYFTLKDGLHLSYPGNEDYVPGYDARQRFWFRDVQGRGEEIVWSSPYLDSGSDEVLFITCSTQIIGRDAIYGVAAMDLPLRAFYGIMSRRPEASYYTLSRQLVDQRGQVVLRLDGGNGQFNVRKPLLDGEGKLVPQIFEQPRLLNAMRRGSYGSQLRMQNGREILWVYSKIPALNWLYVEKIDFAKLQRFPKPNI